MNEIGSVALLVMLGLPSAYGAQYCALRVTVAAPNGSPVETGVILRDEAGRSLQSGRTNRAGVVEFCDLGLELFDVVVGPDVCGQVVVRHLAFTWWPHTAEIKTIYSNCHSDLPSGGCQLVLRVHSMTGQPVENVAFSGTGLPPHTQTDRYGRILAFMPWGSRVQGTLTRTGYRPQPVSIACRPKIERPVQEVITVLQPAVGEHRPGKHRAKMSAQNQHPR